MATISDRTPRDVAGSLVRLQEFAIAGSHGRLFHMHLLQTKHRRCTPLLAAAVLVAFTGVALAQQQTSTSQSSLSFWAWLFSSRSASVAATKPKSEVRSESRSSGGCTISSCVRLVGVGL